MDDKAIIIITDTILNLRFNIVSVKIENLSAL